jgi:hypothetical protein
MIIFRKQYEEARKGKTSDKGIDEELRNLLDEADALTKRADEGVKRERSPLTIVEKVQISDTTKLVKRLIIDINRDMEKGRAADKNREKLERAVTALKTSIENIL